MGKFKAEPILHSVQERGPLSFEIEIQNGKENDRAQFHASPRSVMRHVQYGNSRMVDILLADYPDQPWPVTEYQAVPVTQATFPTSPYVCELVAHPCSKPKFIGRTSGRSQRDNSHCVSW